MSQFLKITLFSLLITISPTMHSMHYAKKAFSTVCTAVHWGISAAPFWANGIYLVTRSEEDISNIIEGSSYEAPSEVEQFVRTQLAEKLPHANSIKIRYQNELQHNANYAAIYSHALGVYCTRNKQIKELCLLDQDTLGVYVENRSPLECLLVKKANSDSALEKEQIKSELNKHRFQITHEASHLKHNDTQNRGWSNLAVPCITQGIVTITKKAFPLLTIGSAVIHNLSKIPTGYVKYAINKQLVLTLDRYREKRADLFATDPEIVQAGINFWQKMETKEKQKQEHFFELAQNELDAIETNNQLERLLVRFASSHYFKRMYIRLSHLNDEHPTFTQRIAYLKKHLKQLKQKA